jgi:hypothetical protein
VDASVQPRAHRVFGERVRALGEERSRAGSVAALDSAEQRRGTVLRAIPRQLTD